MTWVTVDTGTYGAKRQSWKQANPRDLLKRIVDEMGSAPEADVRAHVFDAVLDGHVPGDHLTAIIDYWFDNTYRALTFTPKAPEKIKAQKAAQKRQFEEIKEVVKARATRMALLEMTMPNRKPLAECTGKDCAKAGGWLAKIAAKIKPNEKVGAVLSETQVRKIFAA